MKNLNLVIIFTALASLTSCSTTPVYKVVDNKLEIQGDKKAYTLSCSQPRAYLKEGNSWSELKSEDPRDIHPPQPYYLDGKFYPNPYPRPWCDVIFCHEYSALDNRHIMPIKIVKTGTRPPNNTSVYETRKVVGKLKVSFGYYTDKKCQPKSQKNAVFYFER